MHPGRGMGRRLAAALALVLLTGLWGVGKVVPDSVDSGVVVEEARQREATETEQKEWVGIAEKWGRITNAWMMPLLAMAMVVVVVMQYLVARRVWRVSVWRERYKVYKGVEEFMRAVGGDLEPPKGGVAKGPSAEEDKKARKALKGVRIWDVHKFGKRVEARRLLFGKDVNKFVDKVFEKGLAMATYGEVGDIDEEKGKKEDEGMVKERERIQEWFEGQYGRLHGVFGKYLRLRRK